MISFELNGKAVEVDVSLDTPLLWVMRDHLKLKGTKFGCGMGLCGACSMLIDGVSTRTCILPIAAVANRKVTTIEGLGNPQMLSTLQQAWVENSVPQCGYCQSGQLISASALLNSNPNPSDQQIDDAMSGNICRCGTYPNIKKAIKAAAGQQLGVQTFDPSQPREGAEV
ncbi:(2Fe-2S)-binding protein [Bermanella sp. 47_1433_sub80_T6]|nr:(2Fe-2S)-binding protein [Bermanella sp. 47_1433_sub80_T6]